MRRRLVTPWMVVSIAALVVAASGVAFAAGTISERGASVVSACVHKKGGGLYIARKCARHDRRLRWNIRGPRGARGLRGPQGLQGQQGPQGPQGQQGPANGPAGGDLTGSFPNPRLADGSVTTSTFAAGARAPDSAELGGSPPSGFLQLRSATAKSAVPVNAYGYFMDTSTTADYVFGQARLHTLGVSGKFEVCGNAGGNGKLNYVAYVDGARTAGTVSPSGCTAPFTVAAGGDFTITIRRALIFGVHSGDSTTSNNYDIYGFAQL